MGHSYPDDREASLFYALSLLATADPLDATYARQRQAGEVLERIFKELPDHPAAAHYIIHAYDCGPLAERALEAAERYAKVCFRRAACHPHAVTHLRAARALAGQHRSNLAGEKAERERGIPEDRLHDIDYLVYGYLQIGDSERQGVPRSRARGRAGTRGRETRRGPAGRGHLRSPPSRRVMRSSAAAGARPRPFSRDRTGGPSSRRIPST